MFTLGEAGRRVPRPSYSFFPQHPMNPQLFQNKIYSLQLRKKDMNLPGGPMVKNPPANAVDMGPSLFQEDPTCHGATKPLSHNS